MKGDIAKAMNNTINGRTPDEIKKYAQTWREVLVDDCVDFPYAVHTMLHTAAGLVESLLTEIEQVRRERDAAVPVPSAAQLRQKVLQS